MFQNDGAEVQQHWHSYTQKMDRMVEEAFRLNVKYSLQELSKAINGDGKSAPNPLFRVKVILEGDKVQPVLVIGLDKRYTEHILQGQSLHPTLEDAMLKSLFAVSLVKKMTQTLFFGVKICTQPSSGSRLSLRVM